MSQDNQSPPIDKAQMEQFWAPSGIDIWESRSRAITPMFPFTMKRQPGRKILSPYDVAQANRRYKRIYPNRVYTPWYRRYVNKLPDVESIDFQPFDEVQKIDEDIAMQYFYGEDAQLSDTTVERHVAEKAERVEKRKTALQKYRRVKEQEERDRANAAVVDTDKFGPLTKVSRFSEMSRRRLSVMETEFGATVVEQKVYVPIVDFLQKLHTHKQRILRKVVLKPRSKWHVVKSSAVLLKLRVMYKRLMQEQIHARFRKVIKLVAAVIRFIETIRFISGDTKKILREIENFLTSQTNDTNRSIVHGMKKKVFDPHKYNISKELHIPFDTKLTLTKPWFTRRDDEIDMVIAVLQSYKSFVQYPPMFQRRLATLAWYIETPTDKYIIRERHIACDFYVLLTGKAKVVKMRGSPYIHHNGELSFIRDIKKSEGFGDESMSDPECEREYSVISTEPCALLSISVHDYLQMLSMRKEDEFAPPHIIFLCNLKLMTNFPKVKLLEEGNENITIHYFRPETVVSKNLEDSNFVFVVFSGSCQLLAEVFPDILATPRKEQFTARQRRMSTMRRQTLKREPSFMKVIAAKGTLTSSAPNMTWVKQQIDSQKKSMEALYAMTRISIKDYVEKTQQMMRSLPEHQKNQLYAMGFPQTNAKQNFVRRQSERTATREETSQPVTTALNTFFNRMDSVTSIAEIVEATRKSSLAMTAQLNSRDVHHVKMESRTNLTADKNQKLEDNPSAVESFVTCSESEESTSTVPEITQKVEPVRKSLAPEKRTHIFLYSRWKHIRTLSRGDYTGHEWLDYRDGPFEPPDDIMSLVSHGCEMVMVKKSFLLKYLRKEW